MKLKDCTTVKQCLFWAEGTWPGFWAFSTLEPMTLEDVVELANNMQKDTEEFNTFLERLQEVSKHDRSKEAIELIVKGSKAFNKLKDVMNEHKRPK